MKWNNSISSLYNHKESIETIKNRFENMHMAMHLTLDNLKPQIEFKIFVGKLRNDGWKDWQIISNILNFMINYKIRLFENQILNNTSEENFQEVFHNLFWKYLKIDEKDNYVNFPIEAFESKDFELQFDVGIIAVLHKYNLECKFQTPPFKAIRDFLNVKFNYDKDDYNDINPLKDI